MARRFDPRIRTPREAPEEVTRKALANNARFTLAAARAEGIIPQGKVGETARADMEELAAYEAPERAKPVQHEGRSQKRLADLVRLAWWAPGFRHHDASRASGREGGARKARGQRRGWPDVTLHVPYWELNPGSRAPMPVLGAIELKHYDSRPRRAVPDEWWLSMDWAHGDAEHYGLEGFQAWTLQDLAACGYQTMVAYSEADAFEWLHTIAGPRPDTLPWPERGVRIDDMRVDDD